MWRKNVFIDNNALKIYSKFFLIYIFNYKYRNISL